MPGQVSLNEAKYYAHARNAFWPIICKLLRFELPALDADAPYEQRLELLNRHGVALWDVLASCYRPGSLDADIADSSIVVNDFKQFLAAHTELKAVFFNGRKAETTFKRHVLANSKNEFSALHLQGLPSTSPAHASMSLAQKHEAWRDILRFL